MTPWQTSPTGLLILLCLVVNVASVSVLMLGPLLVALAHAFQTSVAMVGQLGGATALAWGLTAPLAGPVSDAYGQRPMLLIGLLLLALGLFGAVLAWNYQALVAFRLLTGVGAALIPPNSVRAGRCWGLWINSGTMAWIIHLPLEPGEASICVSNFSSSCAAMRVRKRPSPM